MFHCGQVILCRLPALSGPQRTFIKSAANDCSEPSITDAAPSINGCFVKERFAVSRVIFLFLMSLSAPVHPPASRDQRCQ